MHQNWTLLLCAALSIMVLNTQGYGVLEDVDTTDGFCDTPGFGRIPVGETRYRDGTCEKLTCSQGQLVLEGCTVLRNPDCEIVAGLGGQYPSCCPSSNMWSEY